MISKMPEENRVYAVDFANEPEIRAGETIASVANITAFSNSEHTLSIGTPQVFGSMAVFRLSGGAVGDVVRLRVLATTSNGSVIGAIVPVVVEYRTDLR